MKKLTEKQNRFRTSRKREKRSALKMLKDLAKEIERDEFNPLKESFRAVTHHRVT